MKRLTLSSLKVQSFVTKELSDQFKGAFRGGGPFHQSTDSDETDAGCLNTIFPCLTHPMTTC